MLRYLLPMLIVPALVGCSTQTPSAMVIDPPPLGTAEAATDPPPAVISASRSFRDFRPSAHGFRFVNSFSGSPLSIPAKGFNLPERFGLCGGMSCAAADLYLVEQGVPELSVPPEQGTPLYQYIYQRQVSTFAPMGATGLRFLEWMELPDTGADSTLSRTEAELPHIIGSLNRGEPVVVGLVFVGRASGSATPGRSKAWENHQVLAYAADQLPMGVVELRIYDPNYPGRDDAVIRYTPRPDGTRIARVVPGRGITRIRGFFRMPYTPVKPPALADISG